MTAGRPPKPTELKRLMGNLGHRDLPDINNVSTLPMAHTPPTPPANLGEQGLRIWERAWAMAIVWLSPASDIDAVENVSRLADANEAARNRYMATTEPVDAKAYVAINKAYTDALSSLGFDPLSRSRLGVAEVKAATSIDKLLERRQNRAKVIFEEPETVIQNTEAIINDEASSN